MQQSRLQYHGASVTKLVLRQRSDGANGDSRIPVDFLNGNLIRVPAYLADIGVDSPAPPKSTLSEPSQRIGSGRKLLCCNQQYLISHNMSVLDSLLMGFLLQYGITNNREDWGVLNRNLPLSLAFDRNYSPKLRYQKKERIFFLALIVFKCFVLNISSYFC